MTVYYSHNYSRSVCTKDYVDRALAASTFLAEFMHDGKGRPLLNNVRSNCGADIRAELHISVSHSFEVIAIAISDSAVGVDIEKIVKRKQYLRVSEKMGWNISPENAEIHDTANIAGLTEFYRLWTSYEAAYKSQLSSPRVEIFEDKIVNYMLAIASEKPLYDLHFVEI